MKVCVEIEVPTSCLQCRFLIDGDINYCCVLNGGDIMRTRKLETHRDAGCPLEKCEVIKDDKQ